MPVALSPHQVRRLRLRAQRPSATPPASPPAVADVVKALGGVQAQDPSAAALTIRARCAGLLAPDVERARVADRTVVRTWCQRGTLHLLATDDVTSLLSLLGPVVLEARR